MSVMNLLSLTPFKKDTSGYWIWARYMSLKISFFGYLIHNFMEGVVPSVINNMFFGLFAAGGLLFIYGLWKDPRRLYDIVGYD